MSTVDSIPTLSGRIKVHARRSTTFGSPLAGRVIDALVDLSQAVKEIDALLRMSSPEVADRRARRNKTKADVATAHVLSERTQARRSSFENSINVQGRS